MALSPRDVTLTREEVHAAVQKWISLEQRPRPRMRRWLTQELEAHDLTAVVNVVNGDPTTVLDMVMADIRSYK